jgi:hypothetical protein
VTVLVAMVENGRRTVLPWQAVVVLAAVVIVASGTAEAAPRRILVDTDMDTDDLLALLYIVKQNRSEFELKVSDAPHILYAQCSSFFSITRALVNLQIYCLSGGSAGAHCSICFLKKNYFSYFFKMKS